VGWPKHNQKKESYLYGAGAWQSLGELIDLGTDPAFPKVRLCSFIPSFGFLKL
jgi:hypothetical protein